MFQFLLNTTLEILIYSIFSVHLIPLLSSVVIYFDFVARN